MTDEASTVSNPKRRVLFVCEGNTCRSLLAEYIARRNFGSLVEPSSAGLKPGTAEDAENAIYTLESLMGVDARGHVPRDVRTVDVECEDLVVAMTPQIADQVRQLFPRLPVERLVSWQIKDPYGDDLEEYLHCAQSIHKEMKNLRMQAKMP
jgi:protein-tyrosine-phosphatase